MAEEYVSGVILEINGQQIDDWKAIREGEREIRKEVKLARKVGVVKVKSGYPLEVDYVVPKNSSEFDFEGEFESADGTLTIDYENGTRRVFTGVSLLKVGQMEYDGDKELVKPISFLASKRSKT